MKRNIVLMAAIAVLGACQRDAPETNQPAEASTDNVAEVAPPPNEVAPGQPGGLPDDRTLISEGPIDPDSAQGAGQVVQSYAALLEQNRFAEAYRLWSDGGRASGVSQAEFIAEQGKYAEIHMEIGAPGQMEGAAGSSYVEMPVRMYGKLRNGEPFSRLQTVTLRRVNDVPGSTEEQRRWHIYRIEAR